MSARQYRSTVEAKTLSAGINNSITSMTVGPDGTTLPTTFPYTLVIDPDIATEEIVTVTASSGGGATLTIVRGQDGTSAQEHGSGAVVKHMITARDLQEPHDHIEASSGVHGLTGLVVGTTDAQALTNKTITGGTVNATTLQQGGVQAVTTTGAQSLTNKTLTSPTINTPTIDTPTITGTITGAVVTSANIVDATITGSDIASGTITSTNIADGTIVNADINASAAIAQSKVASLTTDLGLKAPLAGPTFTGTVVLPSTTSIGNVSSTELGYVDGVTSAIQTQLNGKLATTGNGTITGDLTVSGNIATQGNNIYFGSGDDFIFYDDTDNTFSFGADNAFGTANIQAGFVTIDELSAGVVGSNDIGNGYVEIKDEYCRPVDDNDTFLGSPTRRWVRVFAVNTTISSSDERDKLDVIESPLGLDFINDLRPVAYRWKVGEQSVIVDENGKPILDEDGNKTYITREGIRKHYGFISQEVKQAVDNSGVDDFAGWVQDDLSDPDSHQSLSYEQFIAPLIKSVQELSAEVETLKAKVAELEVN